MKLMKLMKLKKFINPKILLLIVFISFILLICIINNFNNSTIVYDLYNGDKWDSYRFGDIYRGFFYCSYRNCENLPLQGICSNNSNLHEDIKKGKCLDWMKNEWPLNYLENIDKLYPDSYASKYVRYSGFPNSFKIEDTNILKKILNESSYNKPSENTLVIHLRLGDVVKDTNYSYDILYYKELYEKIKNNRKIKKVDIVTGLHKNENIKESSDKLNEIKHIFDNDYPTEVIITKNPDKDLYYMCHSKFFSRSGGGYSDIICDYLSKDNTVKIYKK
jgi:hypothetical protein